MDWGTLSRYGGQQSELLARGKTVPTKREEDGGKNEQSDSTNRQSLQSGSEE